MFLFTSIKFIFLNFFYLEKESNKGINDELTNMEELEKQRVRDEQSQITNSHKEADDLKCKGNKSDSDENIKTGSESNAGSDAEVMFMLYIYYNIR